MLWVFLTVAAVGLFWLGYRHPYRRRWLLVRQSVPQATLSAVDRQHKHLVAGGRLAEGAVEAAATHFRHLLQDGRTRDLERELRPGVEFAVKVRALALVGTADAARVLERQLTRSLSGDPVEQSWYWADVAAGLRQLGCDAALPAVLQCADTAADLPAGVTLAVEAISFPNFGLMLGEGVGPSRQAALRVLTTAVQATRAGALDPASLLRLRVGELLASVSENAAPSADPWLAAALLEAERFLRRLGHWGRLLGSDVAATAEHQELRLADTAARRREWLTFAADRLMRRFIVANVQEQTAILRCLNELRVDVARLFPQFPDRGAKWWADAVRCLTWSRSAVIGSILTSQALDWLNARRPWRATVLLSTLRGHPSPQTERVILRAGTHRDPGIRQQAARGLGWSSPFDATAVMQLLRGLRYDPQREVREAAVAALARLGERAALQELRHALTSEEPAIRAATAACIADEELTWLWPDLQALAEGDDSVTALPAIEGVEGLRECILGITR